MLYVKYHDNINDSFLEILDTLYNIEKITNVKGLPTKELHPCFFKIFRPDRNVLMIKNRKNNIFQTLYETLWVLTGNDNLNLLEHYLPRCKKWSDDGKTWRAAYGPRLLGKMGGDQINYVINVLQKDPTSRQAIINLWSPQEEMNAFYTGGSKDIPCSNYINFMIRDSKLDMCLCVRSNDVMWGYSSINFYEWTFIQQIIAEILGVELGCMYYYTFSMHYYINDTIVKRVKNILDSKYEERALEGIYNCLNPNPEIFFGCKNYRHLLSSLFNVFKMEYAQRCEPNLWVMEPDGLWDDSILMDIHNMLMIYNLYKHNDLKPIPIIFNKIKRHDLFVAGLNYICRNVKGFWHIYEPSLRERLGKITKDLPSYAKVLDYILSP